MASIALQFNEEHFLTMAYQKAFADKKEEGLLGYIEKLRGILSSNPFSQIRTKGLDKESATIKDINTNEFNEFKNSLNEYLDKIDPMATKSPTLKYLAHNTRKLLDNYQRTNFDTLKENLEKQEKNNLEHVANTAISAKSIISELQNIASLLKTSKEKYANAQQDLKNMTDGLISKNFSVTVKFLYDLEEHGWLKQSAQVSSDISRKIRICVKLDELNQKMATLDEKDTDKIKAIKEEIDRKRPTNHIYQIISA